MKKSVYISKRWYYREGKKYLRMVYNPYILVGSSRITSEVCKNLFLYEDPKTEGERKHNKATEIKIENLINEKRYDYDVSKSLELHKGVESTIEEALDYILENDGLTSNFKKSRGTTVNIIKKYFKGRRLSGCKVKDVFSRDNTSYVMAILAHIDGLDLSATTISAYKVVFKGLLASMYRHGFIKDDISTKFKVKGSKPPIKEPLTIDEITMLADTECKKSIVKKIALFSYYTGLRINDILELRYKNIRVDRSKAIEQWYIKMVVGKTKTPYHAALDHRGANIIRSLSSYARSRDDDSRVFGKIAYSDLLRSSLKDWVSCAGIEKRVTMHTFRHTFAKHLLDRGVEITDISTLLAHTNLQNTMVYLNSMKPIDNHIVPIKDKDRSTLLTDYVSIN